MSCSRTGQSRRSEISRWRSAISDNPVGSCKATWLASHQAGKGQDLRKLSCQSYTRIPNSWRDWLCTRSCWSPILQMGTHMGGSSDRTCFSRSPRSSLLLEAWLIFRRQTWLRTCQQPATSLGPSQVRCYCLRTGLRCRQDHCYSQLGCECSTS